VCRAFRPWISHPLQTQPQHLVSATSGITRQTQYNPHGVFIALEDAGYLMMSLAFLFLGAAFRGRERLVRAIRVLLTSSSILAILSLPVLPALHGKEPEYRYEVVVILIDWIALIVVGVLLAMAFRRRVF
jgi:hypothetical protein